jgi:hypothetical protein
LAVKKITTGAKQFSIGTKNESSLHRALKHYYAGPKGKTEVTVGDYIADCVTRYGEYIEIQTGSFAPLVKKAAVFTRHGKLKVIYPVAVRKQIEVYENVNNQVKKNRYNRRLGKLLYTRKSPVKGTAWDIFNALLYAPQLPFIRGLRIEIVLADIIEKRVKDGKGSWRRRGISIADRELCVLKEKILLEKKRDWLRFIPFKKNEIFTSAEFARRAEIDKVLARKTLYVLTKMAILKRSGKTGNSWLYKR